MNTLRLHPIVRPRATVFALLLSMTGPVPIESLRPGDLVLARDEFTGEQAYKPVLYTITTRPDTLYTVRYELDDGSEETVVTTGEHPFYVVGPGTTAVVARDYRRDLIGTEYSTQNAEFAAQQAKAGMVRKGAALNGSTAIFAGRPAARGGPRESPRPRRRPAAAGHRRTAPCSSRTPSSTTGPPEGAPAGPAA